MGDDQTRGAPDKWSHAPEGQVGGLFRSARHLAGLDQAGLASVQRRLARESQPVRRWRLALAVMAILIFGGGLTALARVGWLRLRPSSPAAEAPPAAPSASRPASAGRPRTADIPLPAEKALPVLDQPAPNPAPGRKRARTRVALGEPARREPPTAPETSAVAAEARSLAVAMEALRARQPARALAALDEHQRKFAAGRLVDEAAVLRVDATLALGRRREALAVLDHLSIAGLPRSHELFVLRAQLRAESGRCAEAAADLRAVPARPGPGGSLAARAAAVRAECEKIDAESPSGSSP